MPTYFYITDLFTSKEYKINRTSGFQVITEGIYEAAIDRYYGIGDSLPDSFKQAYGIQYGFSGPSEYRDGNLDVFACMNDGSYVYACMPEQEVQDYQDVDYDDYVTVVAPRSDKGDDVMEFLLLKFSEEERDRDLIASAQDADVLKWMADYWGYLQYVDRNAAGVWDWLDGGYFKTLLLDITGRDIDTYVEQFLVYDDLDRIDATARDLYERRKALQKRNVHGKRRASKKR